MNRYTITEADIKQAIDYLTNNKLPDSPTRKARLIHLFRNANVINGKVIINGKEVIPKEQINNVLTDISKKTRINGRDSLYGYVCRQYIGISRSEVVKFLDNQELHQINKAVPAKNPIVRRIIIREPHKYLQGDIIDLSVWKNHNNGIPYILTVIDVCSKFAWASAIKNKDSQTMIRALRPIFEREKPKVFHTDNGTEFSLDNLYKEFNITHTKGRPYSPQTQGAIERFNQTLKNQLKLYLSYNNSKRWTTELQNIINICNNTPHSSPKRRQWIFI